MVVREGVKSGVEESVPPPPPRPLGVLRDWPLRDTVGLPGEGVGRSVEDWEGAEEGVPPPKGGDGENMGVDVDQAGVRDIEELVVGTDVGEKKKEGLAVREALRVALKLCEGDEVPEPTPKPGVGEVIEEEERLGKNREGVDKVVAEGSTVFDTKVATEEGDVRMVEERQAEAEKLRVKKGDPVPSLGDPLTVRVSLGDKVVVDVTVALVVEVGVIVALAVREGEAVTVGGEVEVRVGKKVMETLGEGEVVAVGEEVEDWVTVMVPLPTGLPDVVNDTVEVKEGVEDGEGRSGEKEPLEVVLPPFPSPVEREGEGVEVGDKETDTLLDRVADKVEEDEKLGDSEEAGVKEVVVDGEMVARKNGLGVDRVVAEYRGVREKKVVAEEVPKEVEDTDGEGENVGLTLLQGDGVDVMVSGPPFRLIEGTRVGHPVITEEKVD